jgi:hypothetical protein
MEEYLPRPGMQDRYEAGVSAEELAPCTHRLHRTRNRREEHRNDPHGIMQKRPTQFLQNCRRQQIIRHGKSRASCTPGRLQL